LYEEFTRNVRKAGLTLKEFANLLKMQPNSITNLKKNGSVPKHLAVIAALLGEMVDHDLNYERVLNKVTMNEFKRKKYISKGTENA